MMRHFTHLQTPYGDVIAVLWTQRHNSNANKGLTSDIANTRCV